MATLAAAVLFGSTASHRLTIGVVVSLGAILLAVQSFTGGKVAWGLLCLGALGAFTPFHNVPMSHVLISTLDMATLAIFAFSPVALKKSHRLPVGDSPSGNAR